MMYQQQCDTLIYQKSNDISEKQTEEAVKLLEDEKVKSIKKKWNSNTQQELKQLFAKSK